MPLTVSWVAKKTVSVEVAAEVRVIVAIKS